MACGRLLLPRRRCCRSPISRGYTSSPGGAAPPSVGNPRGRTRVEDWSTALAEARRLTAGAEVAGDGSSSALLLLNSLRWLVMGDSEDWASRSHQEVAGQLRRLVGCERHPLLETIRSEICDESKASEAFRLVLPLLSRVVTDERNEGRFSTITHSQKTLAEIVELIRTRRRVLRSVVNVDDDDNQWLFRTTRMNLCVGNKVAILSREFLTQKLSATLSSLRNDESLALMSSAIRDTERFEQLGVKDSQSIPLPSRPLGDHDCAVEPRRISSYFGHAIPEWTILHEMSVGTVLGKSCQAAALMAGQAREVQELAYAFGLYAALVCQASADLEVFTKNCTGTFSFVSAPVLFALADKPELYRIIEAGLKNAHKIDYNTLYREVSLSPALDRTKNLRFQYAETALQILQAFPDDNDAKHALANLILAMQEL